MVGFHTRPGCCAITGVWTFPLRRRGPISSTKAEERPWAFRGPSGWTERTLKPREAPLAATWSASRGVLQFLRHLMAQNVQPRASQAASSAMWSGGPAEVSSG